MLTKGERIRRLREFKGLQLKTFASLMGVSKQTVHFWEIDRFSPTEDKLEAMAKGAGVDLAWLMVGDPSAGDLPKLSETVGTWTMDTPRSPALPGAPAPQSAREAALAAIEVCYLLIAGRAPTEAETALAMRTSLEIFEARRVLARFSSQVESGRTRPSVRGRKDESPEAPELPQS